MSLVVLLLGATIGVSVFDFLDAIDVDVGVYDEVDECFCIMGPVDAVLADCVDRRDETEDDRFLLLRSLLGRPLLPRVLDVLLSSPPRRVFDLRLEEEGLILGVDRAESSHGTSSRNSLFRVCSVGMRSMLVVSVLSSPSSSLPSSRSMRCTSIPSEPTLALS